MKFLAFTTLLFVTSVSFAKTLKISCESREGNTLTATYSISNLYKSPVIKSLIFNKQEIVSVAKDFSDLPFVTEKGYMFETRFGSELENRLLFGVSNCEDSFRGGGMALLEINFDSLSKKGSAQMNCTCSWPRIGFSFNE